jgi:hypothetical protein
VVSFDGFGPSCAMAAINWALAFSDKKNKILFLLSFLDRMGKTRDLIVL